MTPQQEFSVKLARVRELLTATGRRGVLLHTTANFNWLTAGGRSHVSIAAERGVGALLVTPDTAILLADNIELRRLLEEELAGLELETREFPWWSGSLVEEATRIVPASELVSDFPLGGAHVLSAEELMRLRNPLLPAEIERYRALGRDVAVVMQHVAFHCRPSLTEHQLAGMLAGGLTDFGIHAGVTLVAADERAFTRRHPIPTDRRLEKYVMLVIGGRRAGLNLSITRLVHFGPIPEALSARHLACARVDAVILAASRPGTSYAAIFHACEEAYATEGYPGEWQLHHQGGPTGYAARDLKGTPTTGGTVQLHQAFAWNPSIAGTKSEDTVLVTDSGVEVLSETPDLPTVTVSAAGQDWIRAAILER